MALAQSQHPVRALVVRVETADVPEGARCGWACQERP
jgi:hypothetical protein